MDGTPVPDMASRVETCGGLACCPECIPDPASWSLSKGPKRVRDAADSAGRPGSRSSWTGRPSPQSAGPRSSG